MAAWCFVMLRIPLLSCPHMLGLLGMEKWNCTINDQELVFKLSFLEGQGMGCVFLAEEEDGNGRFIVAAVSSKVIYECFLVLLSKLFV